MVVVAVSPDVRLEMNQICTPLLRGDYHGLLSPTEIPQISMRGRGVGLNHDGWFARRCPFMTFGIRLQLLHVECSGQSLIARICNKSMTTIVSLRPE